MKKLSLIASIIAVAGLQADDKTKHTDGCASISLTRIDDNAKSIAMSKSSSPLCKKNSKEISKKVHECKQSDCMKHTTNSKVCVGCHIDRIKYNAEALKDMACCDTCKDAADAIEDLAEACKKDCKANCSKEKTKKTKKTKKMNPKGTAHGDRTPGHAGHSDMN